MLFRSDLDADGMIDALYDNRTGNAVPQIVFEGRLVAVVANKAVFRVAPNEKLRVVGREGTRYVFDQGAWRIDR